MSEHHRPLRNDREALLALRAAIEDALQRMIDVLDALDTPAEDREDGVDDELAGDEDEHALGATEDVDHRVSWDIAEGWSARMNAGGELDTADDEPSLGAPETANQLYPGLSQSCWARGADDDREECDGEPYGIGDEDGLAEQMSGTKYTRPGMLIE